MKELVEKVFHPLYKIEFIELIDIYSLKIDFLKIL